MSHYYRSQWFDWRCVDGTYPGIVKGDPVFDSVAKSFKAQVGVLVKIVDHANVLPATIFLLQHLKFKNKSSSKQQCSLFRCCSNVAIYLRQIPVVQSHNRSDVVLQQMIDQVVVVLHPLFVHMFGWKMGSKS